MAMISGNIFKYSKQLAAFISTPHANKYTKGGIIFVAGLGDGLLCPTYTHAMSLNFRFIQPILSSSYNRFGTSSLTKDAEELLELIKSVKENVVDIDQVVLMGFSTGCQSICTLLTLFGEKLPPNYIKSIVLQGALSDRQYFLDESNSDHMMYRELLEESERNKDKLDMILNLPFMNAPINVYRARSLLLENGDDDFFSVESDACIRRTVDAIKGYPTLFIIGDHDEGLKRGILPWFEMVNKIKDGTEGKLNVEIIKNGDHALNECSDEVVNVMSKWINDQQN